MKFWNCWLSFYRAMYFGAKRGIEIACRLSVRPSLYLWDCDVGGSGPHRLEILETNCIDNYLNTFAVRSPKAIRLLLGEHREISRLEVGWEKWRAGAQKAAISLKRVKIDDKLLRRPIGTHRRSFELVPSPAPYGLPFPRLGVHNPNPKLQSLFAIISGTGKATNFKFGSYIQGSIRTKAHEKLGKRKRGRIQGLPKFLDYHIISGMGKATNFKFGRFIRRVHPYQSPRKLGRKWNVGVSRDCPNFSSTPYYLRNG